MASDTPDIVRRIVNDSIRKVYNMGKIVGSGNFGTVRLATPYSNPHKKFAVKSIPRKRIEKDMTMLE